MRAVRAVAPVRIDLAGGTLDIWPLYLALPAPVRTVNAALDLPVEARVEPLAGGRLLLRSDDLGRETAYAGLADLERDLAAGACPLPLLGEAIRTVAPAAGLRLATRSSAPAGSGLGSSSALLCAVLAALLEADGRGRPARDLHPLVQDVETRLLQTPTGHQDYFPPLLGGCLDLRAGVGGLVVERLAVDLHALGARLRVAYTGEPHESGITNWGVLRAFVEDAPGTRAALRTLAGIACRVQAALAAGDLDAALAAVVEDGAERRRMAPGVATPVIERLDRAARAAGALGTKICGAGGGGCVLVALPASAQAAARVDALLAAGPWRPLPLRLVARGLQVEGAAP